jgi:hypothetical protein
MKIESTLISLGVISILNAIAISIFARLRYALTFALSYFITCISTLACWCAFERSFDLFESKLFWAIVVSFTILIYFTADNLRHWWGWVVFTEILIYTAIQLELKLSSELLIGVGVISVLLVILLRKSIRLVVIGAISGFDLAMGLFLILSSQNVRDLDIISNVLLYGCVGLSIFIQFLLSRKRAVQTDAFTVDNPITLDTNDVNRSNPAAKGLNVMAIRRIGLWLAAVVVALFLAVATTGLEPDDLLKFYAHERLGYVVILGVLVATFFVDKKWIGNKDK